MAKLSACMIVKDEEENLPRCLESIRLYCDEIIVVDTGSTDRTVEIAESFNAKVYHHRWQNDFSLHRNQAFDYATGEWYFVIDADEELVLENTTPEDFIYRLDMVDEKTVSLVVNVIERENETVTAWLGMRFFRASANPRYHHCVHNEVKIVGQAGVTDIILNHYGYHLSAEKMIAKRERTKQLLKRRLEEDPSDARTYYYLCQVAQGDKNFKKVIENGRKCMDIISEEFDDGEQMQFYATLYNWVGNAYMRLDDAGNALSWFMKGLEYFPNDVDLNYLMVVFGHRTNDPHLIAYHGKIYLEALDAFEEKGNNLSDRFSGTVKAEDITIRTTYFLGQVHKDHVKRMMKECCIEDNDGS